MILERLFKDKKIKSRQSLLILRIDEILGPETLYIAIK